MKKIFFIFVSLSLFFGVSCSQGPDQFSFRDSEQSKVNAANFPPPRDEVLRKVERDISAHLKDVAEKEKKEQLKKNQ